MGNCLSFKSNSLKHENKNKNNKKNYYSWEEFVKNSNLDNN